MAASHPGIEVTVQSSHLDMFGHVNHTRYLEFMEWCRFDWAKWHGTPIDVMVREQRMGPAILRAHVQYRRECRLGDRLRVTVEPVSARRSIGVLRQVIRNVETDEVVCEAELTFVMVDLDERRAVALPAMFHATLGGEGG